VLLWRKDWRTERY